MRVLKFLAFLFHCIFIPTEYFTDQAGGIYVRKRLKTITFTSTEAAIIHLRKYCNLCEAEINEIILAARSKKRMTLKTDYDFDKNSL